MSNYRKPVRGTFAAAVLLVASLAAAPAIAKRPPPPPPTDPDPWAGCTPYGPYIYGIDCCGYPDLVVPCDSPPATQPATLPPEDSAESQER